MKIGSLFSGIGGLELGLERAIPGARTVFQVEQDPYARAVLAKHWPHAQRFENVEKVGAHNLPACDLLCGGFPCQDISVAGKRAGINGERSGLWAEYARIIGELRPRFVVVENVSALLSGGMGRVLGDLAACGYDAIWDCVPAAAVGAPHRRDRLFIVAYSPRLFCDGSEHNARSDLKSVGKTTQLGDRCSPPDGSRAEAVAHPMRQRSQRPERGRASAKERASFRHATECSRWEPEPNVGRVADGVPSRVDRLRCLGNAVVPQVAEVVGRVVMQLEEGTA